jgi:hypothetical protein
MKTSSGDLGKALDATLVATVRREESAFCGFI